MSKTIDWLIITEKADQAKHFEKALHIVDGSSDVLDGVVKVVHARGRLYDFAVPDKQNNARYGRDVVDTAPKSAFSVSNDVKYRSDADRLANMPILLNSRSDGQILYEPIDANAGQIADEIATYIRQSEHIIVATDWDIEGELIFSDLVTVYHLTDVLNWDQVYRVKVSDLTSVSIQQAIAARVAYGDATGVNVPGIAKMVAQGYARSIADYEFGYTYSFYVEVIKRQLGLQFKGGLGRLKLGVLEAVAVQENEVASQDTRQKYGIEMVFQDGFRLLLDEQYQTIRDAEFALSHKPKQVNITVRHGEKNILPPSLFTRTSYVIEMDRMYPNVDWGRPLQQAYEKYSTVSYPRTASAYVNMRTYEKLRDLATTQEVQELLAHRISERGYDALAFNKLKPRRKYVSDAADQAAHHAIVPTRLLDTIALDQMRAHGDTRAVTAYMEVFYRTMAMFAENGIDVGQQIVVTDDNDNLLFETILEQTKTLGWRKLVDGPIHSDTFYSGESAEHVPISYEVVPLQYTPKSLFTHATLLSYLTDHNLGTESTREPVISDLLHMSMLCQTEAGGYIVNETVNDVLSVIRSEGLISSSQLHNWDDELGQIETMADAMRFIQVKRNDLKDINKKVKAWYMSKQD